MKRRSLAVAAALSLVFSIGCGPKTVDDTDPGDTNAPDAGASDDDTHSSPPGPDVSTDSSSNPERDTGDDSTSNGGIPKGVPNTITTDGGAAFRADIGAGQTHSVELEANSGDVVVMRLRPAKGDWRPALTVYRPTSGGRKKIAWSKPDRGPAHIPYKDAEISSGWEFYQKGRHILEVKNRSETGGELVFRLKCLKGPCTSGGGDGDPPNGGTDPGADSDGVAAAEDNCPGTDNAGQANNDGDLLGRACDPNSGKITCPSLSGGKLKERIRAVAGDHKVLRYRRARQRLFESISGPDETVVTAYTARRFKPNGIPDPGRYNTEHTVPQSKMSHSGSRPYPRRTDLHHLFPADAEANKKRANLPFDEVSRAEWSKAGSRRGKNGRGWTVFEPRDSHKGDAARAIFYYSVVYQHSVDIDAESDGWGIGLGDEKDLRRWHAQVDPVTSADRKRNSRVEKYQGNRNPFIDCPGLVGNIDNF
ncbi:MAG: endonuclease I family protein [Bradymonadaceae bacterium]